jgi:hypothetical protein
VYRAGKYGIERLVWGPIPSHVAASSHETRKRPVAGLALLGHFVLRFATEERAAPVNALALRSNSRDGFDLAMREILFFVVSSFWAGAAHAATPGHGKTIAAAYIVGARGKPIDAVILGIFVTLSHTSGIVLVGVLASLGFGWLRAPRIEA